MDIKLNKGFTLVELIVVVLLLAIISATAISRFGGRQVYELYALQEQASSVIRQIQLNRMQSNMDMSVSGAESLRLVAANNCIGSQSACDNLSETRSDVIASDDYSFSSVPTSSYTSPIEFNLLGNPENTASSGVQITISSNNSSDKAWVCINSQGFVYPSNQVCL
ncbi:prepilin-type N-terminal cleavage/methylation domain-containing protein [Vibrio cyclitrophicus]|uniref:prepilin-type N-terminal cleavage/methylation domain-containing protein n=1 Tax=Vibrio cyclitrophicus TaxID=47951 RepID=UPI000C8432C9|nr:prepilin-type N-terminal cleavage/methylation domain-containing protein [Vibrio cyclitrophicus]MBU2933592.1 prepilin-type N-terminal cleavage/methylation domain-containing protein [Vibrio cyclitrophicus]MCC4775587.1 prepilin-type N-terminal cleavage/methylation domain-containing protein [Vibrio cyclitrophicus]MCC4842610.1 prepilin-type N-terminal cleavage/methylation domain-containing protein [Vibrio cyclitrophicus]PME15577.1 MSHA biogenesis protein MshC [Vibrio cyclitrophicus]PME45038.1 MS